MSYVNLDPFAAEYFAQEFPKAEHQGGAQHLALCPFHEDHNPSFSFNSEKGFWVCKAGCGQGNIISYHARKYCGGDTKQAYRELVQRFAPNEARTEGGRKKTQPRPDLPPQGEKIRGTGNASTSTRQTDDDPKDLIDPAVLEKYPLPQNIREFLVAARGWSEEVISAHKIGYETKEQRILLPVFDGFGKLANIRKYSPGATGAKMLPWAKGFGSPARLYPFVSLQERMQEPIVLCEGEPDTLCALSHGLLAITNTHGAGTWENGWNQYFRGRTVIVAYDNDEAGRKGIEKLATLPLLAASVEVVRWPEFMQDKEDLTDFIVKYGKSAEDLLALPRRKLEKPAENGNDPDEQYKKEIEELNKRHAAVMVGGQFFILTEEDDEETGEKTFDLWQKRAFLDRYEPYQVNNPRPSKGASQTVSIAQVWLKSKTRREYKKIIFEPGRKSNGNYNLFRGFAATPKRGDWSLMRHHVMENICSGDMRNFDYTLTWMAHILQYPGAGGKRAGTAIVLRGNPGTGKGVFARNFGRILGSHYKHLTNAQHLTGKFNAHFRDAIFVFADEAYWAGDKSSEGVLKGLITEPTVQIEQKGKDIIRVSNHVRILFSSNNEWVVPASMEERRFFVMDVGEKHMQDQDYFKAIGEQMDNGGREAMMYDLLHMDIGTIDKFRFGNFPRTAALQDQIERSMSPVKQWWYGRLRLGTLLDTEKCWTCKAITGLLYDNYVEFCKKAGYNYPGTDASFIKDLRKLIPRTEEGKKSKQFPDTQSKRRWGYIYPSLRECRDWWDQQTKFKRDWEAEEDEVPF